MTLLEKIVEVIKSVSSYNNTTDEYFRKEIIEAVKRVFEEEEELTGDRI